MPAGKRPGWFRVPAPSAAPGSKFEEMRDSLRTLSLNTVCEEASCPNIGECWSGGTATVMLLGSACTRGCRFCDVDTNQTPAPPDPDEPLNVAGEVARWGADYIVLTSVDRDDMPDGGADHFARTVQLIKAARPDIRVECLVSDFRGDGAAVAALAASGLDVYAHNVETVRRLSPRVRDARAGYDQSLGVLREAKRVNPALLTKSSIMVGLGETDAEVSQTLRDLRSVDCDVVTLGQYLRPTERHLSVVEYVAPERFAAWEKEALAMGFKYAASGPLVRSSYKAGEYFIKNMIEERAATAIPPSPTNATMTSAAFVTSFLPSAPLTSRIAATRDRALLHAPARKYELAGVHMTAADGDKGRIRTKLAAFALAALLAFPNQGAFAATVGGVDGALLPTTELVAARSGGRVGGSSFRSAPSRGSPSRSYGGSGYRGYRGGYGGGSLAPVMPIMP
eukprot:IDg9541t1